MKENNILTVFFSVIAFMAHADTDNNTQFSSHPVTVSSGPFVNELELIDAQKHHSNKWKRYIQEELHKPVNFAGHYRISVIKDGILPQDCGNNGWVCGWIIDKLTGKVVSELPEFNGNTKYFPTIDNGTPSPDSFDIEHYPNSSMIWISGQNIPANNKHGEAKCANIAYDFKDNHFIKLTSSRCEVDVGSDSNADSYLP